MNACLFVKVVVGGVGGVSKSDMRDGGDDFLVWRFCELEGPLRFSVSVDGVVVVGCEVVGVGLADFEVMVLE